MATIEELKKIVGELMKTGAEELDSSRLLSGLLASSIGRARLDATLRSRLSVTNPRVYTVKTFGELCDALGIEGAEQAKGTKTSTRSPLGAVNFDGVGVAVGVDIQTVVALPEEADYWEGDFYQQHFTRTEIAYALLQPDPRESFAAAWCAKEALRKADNRWAGMDWKLIEVMHDAAGKPSLRSGEDIIPCSVSLSHAGGVAIAVVAMGELAVAVHQSAPVAVVPAVSSPVEGSGYKGSWLPLFVSVVALLVSLAVAARVVLR